MVFLWFSYGVVAILPHLPSYHQEIREDPEALLAARMGVRIRGAGGLQYFKRLSCIRAHPAAI